MDVITDAPQAQPTRYAKANEWPRDIPRLTHIEAERAILRLYKRFCPDSYYAQPGAKPPTLRRVWVPSKPPFNRLSRGWRRLVHDISHRIHAKQHQLFKGKTGHNDLHAKLEAEMVAYVIEQGWLTGSLKPPEKPKAGYQSVGYQRVLAGIERWEAKQRRAKNALAKLYRQRKYYESDPRQA